MHRPLHTLFPCPRQQHSKTKVALSSDLVNSYLVNSDLVNSDRVNSDRVKNLVEHHGSKYRMN